MATGTVTAHLQTTTLLLLFLSPLHDFGAPYNYSDVGAMRFPKISAIIRVFNLFENANLNTPNVFLNSRLTPSERGFTPFLIIQRCHSSAEGSLFGDLKNHVQTGWEKMKIVDDRPTRLYMTFTCKSSTDLGIQKTPLPTNVVNWCETFDKSTSGITTRLRRLVWKRLLLVDNLALIHQPRSGSNSPKLTEFR
ncbi:uncharacterized protein LACBIDRAFT_329811 [Laccaria bicolor S238N-H82]|uniref:Predicted protein n=1 Tax=Laccaria bicolor (strain S238N-H82 / ATCC MYA-4686) TaxID=486041 RepID=B0DJB1_LACBS|nr:uncharacterized protein LACBIDRAFT_329811 [Laccaria bicolor S238N-H82]EDR05491.1 predicted protein [Laccaria bicolor S238N-H82]|eukprot:XP_001884049.1 predicted protein [Laccaria bicolor S238N-H82]